MQEVIIEVLKVIAGGLAAAGLIYPAYITTFNEAKKLKKEAAKNRHAVAYVDHFSQNAHILQLINDAHENTELDRFIVFVAYNGVDEPTHCDAKYQFRSGEQIFRSYNGYELDKQYKDMLSGIRSGDGHYRFKVAEEKDSSLKFTYMDEHIVDSIISFIHYEPTTGMIIYTSHSTHNPEGLTDMGIHLNSVIVGVMRRHSGAFVDKSEEDMKLLEGKR